jgi:hypothetical protein
LPIDVAVDRVMPEDRVRHEDRVLPFDVEVLKKAMRRILVQL